MSILDESHIHTTTRKCALLLRYIQLIISIIDRNLYVDSVYIDYVSHTNGHHDVLYYVIMYILSTG